VPARIRPSRALGARAAVTLDQRGQPQRRAGLHHRGREVEGGVKVERARAGTVEAHAGHGRVDIQVQSGQPIGLAVHPAKRVRAQAVEPLQALRERRGQARGDHRRDGVGGIGRQHAHRDRRGGGPEAASQRPPFGVGDQHDRAVGQRMVRLDGVAEQPRVTGVDRLRQVLAQAQPGQAGRARLSLDRRRLGDGGGGREARAG